MSVILYKNAKISTGFANDTMVVDFLIEEGRFKDIGVNLHPDMNTEVVDLGELLTLPGGIDPHVHFNTPGFEEREDFEHGSAFACSGGITTVVDMPCTSLPPVTNLESFHNKLAKIDKRSFVDYALWGGISGNSIQKADWQKAMTDLWEAGVVGFKTYSMSGMETFTHLTNEQLEDVIKYGAEISALIGHHAENAEIIQSLTAQYQLDGSNDGEAYYFSRPVRAETTAIEYISKLAAKYNTKIHIVHVSSGKSASIINKGRQSGINISAETCPHYLFFNYKDFVGKSSTLKTAPVVKTARDSQQLWDGINDGTISFIASDHAPCPVEQKNTGSIWTDYGGIPGVGTILPILFSEAYLKGKITLAKLIEITSLNQAKRFSIYPVKGVIQKGSDADFVCIDEKKVTVIQGSKFFSKGKLTPFENWKLQGRVIETFLRGKSIYSDKDGISNQKNGIFISRLDFKN